MKILLLTLASDGYAALAAITEPTKFLYAQKWGYDFRALRHVDLKRIAWERPEFWLRLLAECDWLFFTGSDVMITNPAISLRDRFSLDDNPADFIFAADGNGLNSDSWIMRNCPATVGFLQRVLAWEGRVNNEQDAMGIELARARNYVDFALRIGDLRKEGEPPSLELLTRLQVNLSRSDVRVMIMPQRAINAYPHEHYGHTNDLPHSWQPGDFVLHMPGKTLEYRIQHMPKYVTR